MTRLPLLLAALLCASTALPSQAQGLALTEQVRQSWPTRLVVGQDWNGSRGAVGSLLNDLWANGGVPLGRDGLPSGLRASGGMVLGGGSAALAAASVMGGAGARWDSARLGAGSLPASPQERPDLYQPQPYLGIGYTHRSGDGTWDLSADLGMVGASDSSISWGRTLLDPNRLDEAVRNLRLRPILQFGARYRF